MASISILSLIDLILTSIQCTYLLKSSGVSSLALKMDQFNQIDNTDPFFSPPPPSPPLLPPPNASDALALPPQATYPSKEALFEAIQSWSKLRGYAFAITRSKL